jgi:hypothetical protein
MAWPTAFYFRLQDVFEVLTDFSFLQRQEAESQVKIVRSKVHREKWSE